MKKPIVINTANNLRKELVVEASMVLALAIFSLYVFVCIIALIVWGSVEGSAQLGTYVVVLSLILFWSYPFWGIVAILALYYMLRGLKQYTSWSARLGKVGIVILSLILSGLVAILVNPYIETKQEVIVQDTDPSVRLTNGKDVITFELTKIIKKHSLLDGMAVGVQGSWQVSNGNSQLFKGPLDYTENYYGPQIATDILCTSPSASAVMICSDHTSNWPPYPTVFFYIPNQAVIALVRDRTTANRTLKIYLMNNMKVVSSSCDQAGNTVDFTYADSDLNKYTWKDVVDCVNRIEMNQTTKQLILDTDVTKVLPLKIEKMTNINLELLQQAD